MGHPLQTREQILAAATHLVHLQGFNNTSLDDVLKESGVGKGNFYYYFKNKEELGYAVLDRVARGFEENILDQVFSPTVPPLERINQFLDRVLEIQRQRGCVGGCPMGNLALELSDLHEGYRKRLDRIFFELWSTRISDTLKEAKTGGQLRPETDIHVITQFIIAGIQGAILLAKVKKDTEVLEACLGQIRRHLRFFKNQANSPINVPLGRHSTGEIHGSDPG